RVVRHALLVDALGRVGGLRQLALGLVADAVAVAVGLQRIARDVDGQRGRAADRHIPAAGPGAGRFAGASVVDLVPDLLPVRQPVVVAVRDRRVGAELCLLAVGQPVAVAVALDGRERNAILAALQLIAIRQAVAVLIPGRVVGVEPMVGRREQAIAVGV